jgi:hypothetical protein
VRVDPITNEPTQKGFHVRGSAIAVEHAWFDPLPSTECQQLASQEGASSGGGSRSFDCPRIERTRFIQNIDTSQYDGQQIVELVGNPPREPTHYLQTLRVAQDFTLAFELDCALCHALFERAIGVLEPLLGQG